MNYYYTPPPMNEMPVIASAPVSQNYAKIASAFERGIILLDATPKPLNEPVPAGAESIAVATVTEHLPGTEDTITLEADNDTGGLYAISEQVNTPNDSDVQEATLWRDVDERNQWDVEDSSNVALLYADTSGNVQKNMTSTESARESSKIIKFTINSISSVLYDAVDLEAQGLMATATGLSPQSIVRGPASNVEAIDQQIKNLAGSDPKMSSGEW
jgi:hypothetical protein